MSDDTSRRRATRRPALTQPVPGRMGRPTAGQDIRYTPISPDEWADIIRLARTQRTEEAITAYGRRKQEAS